MKDLARTETGSQAARTSSPSSRKGVEAFLQQLARAGPVRPPALFSMYMMRVCTASVVQRSDGIPRVSTTARWAGEDVPAAAFVGPASAGGGEVLRIDVGDDDDGSGDHSWDDDPD
jgi:hypothetical protein